MEVAYVGLGAMGSALARRLLLSRSVTVYDVAAEALEPFRSEGARVATALPALAGEADVIMVCVPTSAVVREVVFGSGGLAAGLSPGKIIVDQSTGDPSQTRALAAELEELGVSLVDAPVSGGPRGAVAGTIAIMCGGPEAAVSAVQPILEQISPNIVRCGGIGNGHVAKLVNNAVAACNRLITYEAAATGCKYGLGLATMAAVINKSSGWNGASERILPVLASAGQTAQFQLGLMAKDLRIASAMAAGCGVPLSVVNLVRSTFEAGVNQLGAGENLDRMADLFEAAAGMRFADAP